MGHRGKEMKIIILRRVGSHTSILSVGVTFKPYQGAHSR
jgi:hypothetical protein